MKTILASLNLIFLLSGLHGQVIFEEDFETGSIPTGWTIQTNATDGGWKVGSAASLSSQYFPILSNGSPNIAATNDDQCNCNKSSEYFITPPIDLSAVSAAVLRFDSYYTDQTQQGIQENARIEISTDGVNWTLLDDLHGHGTWDQHSIDISSYAGEDNVLIGFYYTDGGGWLYGFGIDNVVIEVPYIIDANLESTETALFGEVNKAHTIKFTASNNGVQEITSMNVSYTIDGGNPNIAFIDSLNIASFQFALLAAEPDWYPSSPGVYTIDLIIEQVNGVVDENTLNNSLQFEVTIFDEVIVPNMIDLLLADAPIIEPLSVPSGTLNRPTDLDFFPIYGKNELWVINERSENIGGSTLKISEATAQTPTYLHQVDGNSWHFMSLPTAIAFSSDNFNFASSPGVQDANHNGGTFTGPSLWSSDPDIYAQPSGGNGSHLDMLHGSPKSMGIAHEVDNVFWVYDNWNKHIVRYDFVEDHGPGNDDHADAIIRRYRNIGINAQNDIPNHMVLDKNSGWLYFADNGNDRILRLDVNSGMVSSELALINEALAEHSDVTGFTIETVVDVDISTPCGLEIFENYLIVGEYFSGDIVVYDMSIGFIELGRINTNNAGLTGIKVGPEGNIWFTNRLRNELSIVSPNINSGTRNEQSANFVKLYPNPSTGDIWLNSADIVNDGIELNVYAMNGKKIISKTVSTGHVDLAELNPGIYTMKLVLGDIVQHEQIVIQK